MTSSETHVSLVEFLAPLTAAIKSVAASTWVAAEISEISDRHHIYITLVENDEEGKQIASLKVSLWASGKAKLLTQFEQGTGGEKLRKGLRVLLKLKPSLHPLYGLSATVEGIDPTFTIGEAARKLIELRKRLQEEGLYDAQKAFTVPLDFTSVAVLCPSGAAGLGDFKSSADPLDEARLCEFIYFNASFQGERASPEIVSGLREIYRQHREQPFDALIILRGGGAQADLAWLNDYAIAAAITKMPLPVLVAIGHERDVTILDEIANVSFHTPSKAIGYVASAIISNAQDASKDWESIVRATESHVALRTKETTHLVDLVRHFAYQDMASANESVDTVLETIAAGAHRALDLTQADLKSQRGTIQDASVRQHAGTVEDIEVQLDAIYDAAHRTTDDVTKGLAHAQDIIRGQAQKGLALATHEITGCRLLIKDRSILTTERKQQDVDRAGQTVSDNARRDIDEVMTDIDGRRMLIKDRAILGVKTLRDTVKADAEFVIGIGPKKTLARGFSMTKKKGKAVTRKSQVAKGDLIEVDFADGNVEALVQ